jgi:anti-anti-sigma factor
MRNFKIIKEQCSLHESLTVFRFKGSLDAERVQIIADQFNIAIEKGEYFIIAEMSEVSFISSPALGELMGCKKRLVEKGGNLYLVGLNTENRNKLRLMGAEKIFEFLQSIGAAVRKYHWENEDTGDAFSVSIPPILGYVPELRNLFSDIISRKGYSKRDAFRVEAIIDELCNNAIEYGSSGTGSAIQVQCKVFQYQMELLIMNQRVDEGQKAMDIDEIRKRIRGDVPFNLNEKRGRGIELVKMLCDEFDVNLKDDMTIIRILKKKEV